MKRVSVQQIIGYLGLVTVSMNLGSATVLATDFEDSAESTVDILVKDDPNVEDKVFKFDAVPTGFSFVGDTSKVTASSKLAMQGQTEGTINNIRLKTDIENAEQSNFKVIGMMSQVTRKSDQKVFKVDTFTMTVGEKKVDVKSGNASIMDKSTVASTDKESSTFYDYLNSHKVTGSDLVIDVDASLEKGDEFSGNLVYTLSGSIDFA